MSEPTCDECGKPARHCIGGESYYCDDHTPYDTFDAEDNPS